MADGQLQGCCVLLRLRALGIANYMARLQEAKAALADLGASPVDSNNVGLKVGLALTSAALLIGLCAAFVFLWRRRRRPGAGGGHDRIKSDDRHQHKSTCDTLQDTRSSSNTSGSPAGSAAPPKTPQHALDEQSGLERPVVTNVNPLAYEPGRRGSDAGPVDAPYQGATKGLHAHNTSRLPAGPALGGTFLTAGTDESELARPWRVIREPGFAPSADVMIGKRKSMSQLPSPPPSPPSRSVRSLSVTDESASASEFGSAAVLRDVPPACRIGPPTSDFPHTPLATRYNKFTLSQPGTLNATSRIKPSAQRMQTGGSTTFTWTRPCTLAASGHTARLLIALANAAQSNPPDRIAGRYALSHERARGGQAVVNFAHDAEGAQFLVAIKCASRFEVLRWRSQ